ncbi:hypothetical protein [Nissabacter sp. SGAir0207]|nr:hypothetical protein [Nissabacter sp. SGAir0207]
MNPSYVASDKPNDKHQNPAPSKAEDKDDPHSAPEAGDKEPETDKTKH